MTDQLSLVPGVIIATPNLIDPNFRRTVVLMVQHDDEGTLGLVLNRPTEHLCSAVTDSLEIGRTFDEESYLSVGGPVEPQSLWIVHPASQQFSETINIGAELAVSRSERALRELCDVDHPKLRLFVGYAGWGPGQLDQEIREGAWLTTELTSQLVFDVAEPEIWDYALGTLGINALHLSMSTDTLQ